MFTYKLCIFIIENFSVSQCWVPYLFCENYNLLKKDNYWFETLMIGYDAGYILNEMIVHT